MRISDWSSDVCSSDLLRDLLVSAAEAVHGARRVVLGHHVGLGDQAMRDLQSLFGLEVEREATLVAIEAGEESGCESREAPRLVAAGRGFDLDDVGAEIGQHQPAGRAHDGLAERSEAHTSELQSLMRISYAVFCLK